MKSLIAPGIIALLLATAVAVEPSNEKKLSMPPQKAATPTAAQVTKEFRKYTQMTDKEVYVDPPFAFLCDGPSKEAVENAKLKAGPHANSTIQVYMNALASDAFRAKTKSYPVGAVVVKDKKMLGYHEAIGSGKWVNVPEKGVGGMIKREPGYDPANSDWEYFYSEDNNPMVNGALISCIQCHKAAKATGYVFGDWNRQKK